jgi:type I restriction-modification system DNA methylase subunit
MSVTMTTTNANTAIANNQNYITELRHRIWQIAENHLSKVKTEVFANYVSCLFFYRFISENLTFYLNKSEQIISPYFDYPRLLDEKVEKLREPTLKIKGFFIPPSLLFRNVLEEIKNNPYFVPDDLSYGAYYITVGYYTCEEIDSKDDVTDVSVLIEFIFDKLYSNTYSTLTPTEKSKFRDQWSELFKPVDKEFLELGDPLELVEWESMPLPKLINTIKRKNEKLIEIMDAVSEIPLDDLIKETSGYDIKEILEIQEEIIKKWASK